jgi:hypothetical protein
MPGMWGKAPELIQGNKKYRYLPLVFGRRELEVVLMVKLTITERVPISYLRDEKGETEIRATPVYTIILDDNGAVLLKDAPEVEVKRRLEAFYLELFPDMCPDCRFIWAAKTEIGINKFNCRAEAV